MDESTKLFTEEIIRGHKIKERYMIYKDDHQIFIYL